MATTSPTLARFAAGALALGMISCGALAASPAFAEPSSTVDAGVAATAAATVTAEPTPAAVPAASSQLAAENGAAGAITNDDDAVFALPQLWSPGIAAIVSGFTPGLALNVDIVTSAGEVVWTHPALDIRAGDDGSASFTVTPSGAVPVGGYLLRIREIHDFPLPTDPSVEIPIEVVPAPAAGAIVDDADGVYTVSQAATTGISAAVTGFTPDKALAVTVVGLQGELIWAAPDIITADADGAATFTATLPADLAPGSYQLRVVETHDEQLPGDPVVLIPFELVAEATSAGTGNGAGAGSGSTAAAPARLTDTGAELAAPAGLALLALAGGAGALGLARRSAARRS